MMTKNVLLLLVMSVVLICSGCSEKEQIIQIKQVPEQKILSTPTPVEPVPKKREPIQSKKSVFTPVKLMIPSIQIDAVVEPVGVLENGQMGVPGNTKRVGILIPGTKAGENGNVVMAGHVDNHTGSAVFYHLNKMKIGNQVIVLDKKGQRLVYIVENIESYPTSDAPLKKIFGQSDEAHLNLITCSGNFNKGKREYEQRLVVFTHLSSM